MFLQSREKTECYGCEGCAQACARGAIEITEDEEGFRYPEIDESRCLKCGACLKVCPYANTPEMHAEGKYAFGGYNLDKDKRFESTSGGAFSAIVDSFCDENYVVFGAEAQGLSVFHSYTTDKHAIGRFRKSKYLQSAIGHSYKTARDFLEDGKKVLFSGTPCQIAGLLSFLGKADKSNLLTVEVVCEGVPSPLYVRKLDDAMKEKHGSRIESIDYRYTGRSIFNHGKWDFQQMRIGLENKRTLTKDRWFNPFWSIWLRHLMSRPSCYRCKFATESRVADITLGDLWGVHLYCPELYGGNGGSSLVVCNTEKGKTAFSLARKKMFGHELDFGKAVAYQSPMRKSIEVARDRKEFMADLGSDMSYGEIVRKWATKPNLLMLWRKYVYGNRQKIALWNLRRKLAGR